MSLPKLTPYQIETVVTLMLKYDIEIEEQNNKTIRQIQDDISDNNEQIETIKQYTKKLIMCDTDKIDELWKNSRYYNLDNVNKLKQSKLDLITLKQIVPPYICVNNENNGIEFINGRHRFF